MHTHNYNAFYGQNYENNFFDVIFDVEGKELFAHREVLAAVSPIFKELFIKNRHKSDAPIRIENYSYDEFYEFLRCIYCINDNMVYFPIEKSIFATIELSHIYQINEIKEKAGEVLLCYGGFKAFFNGAELNDDDFEDMFEKIEIAEKYSVKSFKQCEVARDFRKAFLSELIEYNGFVNLEEAVVKGFVKYVNCGSNVGQKEELCKVVYKWGEHQAMVNDEMPEEERKEVVLHQIKEVLPFLPFKYTSFKFLFEFAVPKSLITVDDANKYATIDVSVYSGPLSLTGFLIDSYGISQYIQSHQEKHLHGRDEKKRCFWKKQFEHPSTPSSVEKMKSCEWYLAFDQHGKLNLKHQSKVDKNDYLLAEMKSKENGAAFFLDRNRRLFASAFRKL